MFEIITIIALLAGPVLAVLVSLSVSFYIERWKEKRREKWDILRSLMAYRRTPLTEEFVKSLNLIEVIFYKDKIVSKAWKNLLAHFLKTLPRDEDSKGQEEHRKETEKLEVALIKAIASELNVKYDGLDILYGGYNPNYLGWVKSEMDATRSLTLEVLKGNRPIPMYITNWPDNLPNPEESDN